MPSDRIPGRSATGRVVRAGGKDAGRQRVSYGAKVAGSIRAVSSLRSCAHGPAPAPGILPAGQGRGLVKRRVPRGTSAGPRTGLPAGVQKPAVPRLVLAATVGMALPQEHGVPVRHLSRADAAGMSAMHGAITWLVRPEARFRRRVRGG
jgi:hypothetical protein